MAKPTQSNDPIRIVQLSDFHLYASPGGKLLGLNTDFSLNAVLDLIAREQPHAHLMLATGDISQDGSSASYERFHQYMADRFDVPVYWLPGNHDALSLMGQHKAANFMSPCVIDLDEWMIVMLDSTEPGEVGGNMAQTQLDYLQSALEHSDNKHTIVCLHHQPVPVGSAWLDQQIIDNSSQLTDILDAFSNVRALCWGHVHQDFVGERNGVKLMAVPSTCVQFKPDSEDFAIDTRNPGYRWLDLHPDGRIDTGVSRVMDITFEIDYSGKGY